MDYGKLDAGLRSSLTRHKDNPEYRYTVFIHVATTPALPELQLLKDAGIGEVQPGRKIITADMPAESIGILSDQPWVTAIRLSRKLRQLDTIHDTS